MNLNNPENANLCSRPKQAEAFEITISYPFFRIIVKNPITMNPATAKKLSLLLSFFCMGPFLFSQASKGIKHIEKGQYEEAYTALRQGLTDEENVSLAQFGMGKLHATVGFSNFNLDTAYHYTLLAEQSFRKMDSRLKNKLSKDFNTSLIKNQKKDIAMAAFSASEDENTLESWDHFLDYYPKPGFKYEKEAALARNKLAFNHAEKTATWQAYAELLEKYGSNLSNRSPELYKKAQTSLFNLYIRENSWDSFETFAEAFPQNYFIKNRVLNTLDSLSRSNSITALDDFILQYRNTPFAARGVDSLAAKLPRFGTYEENKRFIENYPTHPANQQVWEGLYLKYQKTKPSLSDLEQFERMYPDFPFKTRLEADKNRIKDDMYQRVIEDGTITGNKNFIDQFPDYEKIDSVWLNYYQLYKTSYPGIDYLERFGSLNPEFPFQGLLQADKSKAIDLMAEKLLKTEDVALHKAFVDNYPNHARTKTVLKAYYALYKKEAKNWEALESFKKKYPGYPNVAEIDKDIAYFKHNEEKIAKEAIALSENPKDFFDYLDKFPESKNTPEITGMLVKALLKSTDKNAMENYARRFPNGKNREVVLKNLYQTIASEGSKTDLMEFMDKYPGIIPESRLEEDLQNVKIKDFELGLFDPSKKTMYSTYIKQNAPEDKAYNAMRSLIKPLLTIEDFDAAAKEMEALKPYFGDKNDKFNKLYTILTTEGQIVHSGSIGANINTQKAMEYAPIISADDKTLLICRNEHDGISANENIHISKKENGIWQEAIPIPELSTLQNEAPEALSADGNSMILFVEGKICTSEKQKNGWSSPKPLSNAINKNSWQADARITADGNAILFASGSSVYADDIDIYISVKDKDGNWTQAHSLGNVINTNKADRAPYLHPDLKTLYFCSKGHVGIGEFDVFVSKRLDDGWTHWSEPVNLGKGINTVNNEWEFKVTTDGSQAYFSKEKAGGDVDIYIADLPEAYQPDKVATISGSLKGINGEPISAEIQWQDLETGEIVQITRSDPASGDFFATLPKIGKFGYSIKHPDFFPLSGNVDLTEGVKNFKLEEEMVLTTVEEMRENRVKLKLNNLFFETAKYEIKPTSYPELDRLANWMKEYALSIDILGHTDNVGEEADNQLLSENRSKAVKAYLIEKGCAPESITAIGFGEKEPVENNETTKGRAQNRRVEIRIRE